MKDDPCESMLAMAMQSAGISFLREPHPDTLGLDFYLPDFGVHIEVKRFGTPRSEYQMRRAKNVILVQGLEACCLFAMLAERGNRHD